MEIQIYLFLAVSGAYLIKSLTGFGNTLIINSLLSIVKENRFITPVDLLLGLPANIYMAWKDREAIDVKIVAPLSIMVLAGNIPGILLLNMGGDKQLKTILGAVLVLLAIEMYVRKPRLSEAQGSKVNGPAIYMVGIISGVLMGLFGIGALLAAFIGRQTGSRSNYRGNLCFVFVIDNLFRLVMYCINGLINLKILAVSLSLLPAVAIGMFFGRKIDSKISDKAVKNAVIALLFISGIVYIVKNRVGII
ncbi:sulfite exporter TauE/SafE family protein [Ruminiclostridium cellobioparum]|uniref:Probable membrane transporter protein n=1 Tax=Ruminiclostridium cellobioparum subsp. termitidis CT1112 TaxID=1195236 RepID=S0FML4_RUMCE|nr:sulfite exporter TauE/SafE family protein [Ruminiclostridium cellobioparum]EMS69738.1 Sulfite exporter TauE/SafE [Ruminiclostridium cellobioparum subsp. termitidis CT1112]